MGPCAAYIGEAGNYRPTAKKSGAPSYFVLLAVIADAADLALLHSALAPLCQRLAAAAAAPRHDRADGERLDLMRVLVPLPFRFYAMAVDKRRVDIDAGLAGAEAFIGFVNGRVYRALFQSLADVAVYADSAAFIDSFTSYIEQHHMPDLFSRPRVEAAAGDHAPAVLLAGFLADCTAALYDGSASPALRQQLLEMMGARRIRVDEWPPRFESQLVPPAAPGDLDAHVRRIALRAAGDFLAAVAAVTDAADAEDGDLRAQHALLSYLLFRARFPTEEDFISTAELVDHLRSLGFSDVSDHYLRSNLISRLRDRDILIASSARGYKIPTSYADIIGFAELVDGIVSPLLHRLKRANDVLARGSAGAVDFLDEARFRNLRELLKL